MGCNNGLFGGNCCTWIIILILLFVFCGDGGSVFGGNNGCGCNNGGCNSCNNGCGCHDNCC